MRDPFVAIDTGPPRLRTAPDRAFSPRRLLRGQIHKIENCGSYGIPASCCLHAPPLILCHCSGDELQICGASISPNTFAYSSLLALIP